MPCKQEQWKEDYALGMEITYLVSFKKRNDKLLKWTQFTLLHNKYPIGRKYLILWLTGKP